MTSSARKTQTNAYLQNYIALINNNNSNNNDDNGGFKNSSSKQKHSADDRSDLIIKQKIIEISSLTRVAVSQINKSLLELKNYLHIRIERNMSSDEKKKITTELDFIVRDTENIINKIKEIDFEKKFLGETTTNKIFQIIQAIDIVEKAGICLVSRNSYQGKEGIEEIIEAINSLLNEGSTFSKLLKVLNHNNFSQSSKSSTETYRLSNSLLNEKLATVESIKSLVSISKSLINDEIIENNDTVEQLTREITKVDNEIITNTDLNNNNHEEMIDSLLTHSKINHKDKIESSKKTNLVEEKDKYLSENMNTSVDEDSQIKPDTHLLDSFTVFEIYDDKIISKTHYKTSNNKIESGVVFHYELDLSKLNKAKIYSSIL